MTAPAPATDLIKAPLLAAPLSSGSPTPTPPSSPPAAAAAEPSAALPNLTGSDVEAWLADWLGLAGGPAPCLAALLAHLAASVLVLRGLSLAVSVPPLALALGFCYYRSREARPDDTVTAHLLAPQEEPIGPTAVATAWLLGGALARDPEVSLLAGVLLTLTPGLQRWKLTALLAIWLARAAYAAGRQSPIGAGASGPVIVFLVMLVGQASDSIRSKSSRPSPVPTLALPPASEQGRASVASTRAAPSVFERAIKCFPNWAPPSHKEVRVWTKTFALREELLAVYACAVPAKLLHSGSLYISIGHVCFQGVAIITHSMNFKIALEEIKEVRYGGSREVATLVLKRPVLMKGRKDHVTSVELRGCEAGCAAISALIASPAALEEDSGTSSDEDESPASVKHMPTSPVPSVFADAEPFQSLFDVRVHKLKLSDLAEELLAPVWAEGTLIMDKVTGQGATEISVSDWIDDASEELPGCIVKVREVTSRIPVPPAPMCPRSTRVTTTFRISVSPDKSVLIESSGVSHDVPFGDKFLVQERIVLKPLGDGEGVNATQLGRCIFLKSCGMLQGRIKSSAMAGVGRAGEQLISLLNQRASKAAEKEALTREHSKESTESPKVTCTLQIWELQRRTTLMHTDWRAPFLPHDGKRRWRWVDTSYQIHPWTTTHSREESAMSTTPPVHPTQGWTPLGDWEVKVDGGDAEGWQYASVYHSGDRHWSTSTTGHHVRRRLWVRSFTETEVGSGAPPAMPCGPSRFSVISNHTTEI